MEIESNLIAHARKEFALAGYTDSEGPNAWMREGTIKVIEAFSKEGHSGSSASYAIDLIWKLLQFQPLTPLTGSVDEWIDRTEMSGGEPLWQNIRDSTVFKTDKEAWTIASGSKVTVTFPYDRYGIPATPVAETKKARKDLDAILQTIKTSLRFSRERSLAQTKIEEAIMWLGMDLKAQNEPNPYPNSYNPASPVVDPTADGLKL